MHESAQSPALSEQQRTKLERQLKVWQDELINLTRRNKLLYFRHTKTSSLEIEAPSMRDVHARLSSGHWDFYIPPTEDLLDEEADNNDRALQRPPARNELVIKAKTAKEINSSLRSLEKVATQTQIDSGLWILYLGFGMLHWIDADDKAADSPLLLVPVAFNRSTLRADFRLVATDDEPVLNPALAIKLANDFGISLPTDEDVELDPGTVVEAVRRTVGNREGWRVDERVVLTTFTFHKDAMYRDLVDNAEEVSASALVQVLALGPEAPALSDFAFDPPSEDTLDIVAPPEDLVSVRDADATQRTCIVAARDGRSFVMNGPPGTGKSQTITNVIAELLAAGKSVLFVSEKAAALDVVHKRLAEAHLDEFTLELHSHKATRKEVAAELGQALERRPKATSRFAEQDRARLAAARRELNDYAIALNAQRQPLGQSLQQVIGRVVALQHFPHAAAAGLHGTDLTPEQRSILLDQAERLGRSWGPVARGSGFLWRHLRDPAGAVVSRRQTEDDLDHVLATLNELHATLTELDEQLGLSSANDRARAAATLTLLDAHELNPRRSRLPVEWLTRPSTEDLRERLDAVQAIVDRYSANYNTATAIAASSWHAAPHHRLDELQDAIRELQRLAPRVGLAARTREEISELTAAARTASAHASSICSDTDHLTDGFGLDPAEPLTLQRVRELVELGHLIATAERPEPAWLNPVNLPQLAEAVSSISELITEYRSRRDSLSTTFTDDVLALDLVNLRARLREASGLRKLGGAYRSDRNTLEACVIGGKLTDAVLDRLDDAVAWQQHAARVHDAERQHSAFLGRHYAGPMHTDLDRLHRAADVARRAVALTDGRGLPALVANIAHGGSHDPALYQLAQHLHDAVSTLPTVAGPTVAEFGIDLDYCDLRTLPGLLDQIASASEPARHVLDDIAQSTGADLTVEDGERLLHATANALDAWSDLSQAETTDRALLGPSYQQLATNFAELAEDLRWAETVRAAAGGPLHHSAAQELVELGPCAERIRDTLDRLDKEWGQVASLFDPDWRERLEADFAVSFADGRALIEELRDTIVDIDEWDRCSSARTALEEVGLGPVVAYAEQHRVAAGAVAPMVERSILERWIDATIAEDERLSVLDPGERDALVERFRALDRALVANAAARVVTACSERRPSTTNGAAGIIRREAVKKTRHLPIRKLLAATREVALRLKPCFMMSPLSVSQYLPPDLKFDVVIFDEASQVRPSDAANCIYRGRQLIVAGDQRQLPPSTYFDRVADDGTGSYDDDDDDAPAVFESVLDVCLGSGLPDLPLRWHYRSQHESLITYSNYRFYEGKLHTFPGAIDRAADVGVELIPADGVYRRGGARDNPIEAAKVVERVLHHQRHHPKLTLGVVAFSSAQETAIVAEIERQSAQHPELDELLSGDRLDGFFVKNLENVQGDERDIIIFSVGYGKDENGKFTEQLGPLGQAGGERRLNVAITRARRRVEVVASIRSGDFPGTSEAAGVRHLQRYLDFAERGTAALALEVSPEGRDVESEFEAEVARVVQNWGYTPVPQVGVAGYRIDLGVRNPSKPGEYILGIECDGAAYHSSRVARDRDRLRQEILEALGWRIYRIWGPSWYRDRSAQEQQLRTAIEAALAGRDFHRQRESTAIATASPTVVIEEATLDDDPAWITPYVITKYPFARTDIDLADRSNKGRITQAIVHFAQHEGPIHEDLLRHRVLDSFGVRRTGHLIKDAYDAALRSAMARGEVMSADPHFVSAPVVSVIARGPTTDEDTQRKVEHVAPSERQLAIRQLVEDAHRIDEPSLLVAFARIFGWRRAGADIQSAFDSDLKALLQANQVRRGADDAVLPGETSTER